GPLADLREEVRQRRLRLRPDHVRRLELPARLVFTRRLRRRIGQSFLGVLPLPRGGGRGVGVVLLTADYRLLTAGYFDQKILAISMNDVGRSLYFFFSSCVSRIRPFIGITSTSRPFRRTMWPNWLPITASAAATP